MCTLTELLIYHHMLKNCASKNVFEFFHSPSKGSPCENSEWQQRAKETAGEKNVERKAERKSPPLSRRRAPDPRDREAGTVGSVQRSLS